jgi:hypothetical protein
MTPPRALPRRTIHPPRHYRFIRYSPLGLQSFRRAVLRPAADGFSIATDPTV